MKKTAKILVAMLLLGSLTIQADPLKNWFWDDPTQYENGANIPGGDLTQRKLYCGMQQGGPYPAEQVFDMQAPPSLEDMAFVVAGLPGTYYCVSTVASIAYGTESGFSNEVNFTVAPGTLGFVPRPPILSLQ
jgi:hypothetical protein